MNKVSPAVNKTRASRNKVWPPVKEMGRTAHIINPGRNNVHTARQNPSLGVRAAGGRVKLGKLGKIPENSENSGFMPRSVDGIY